MAIGGKVGGGKGGGPPGGGKGGGPPGGGKGGGPPGGGKGGGPPGGGKGGGPPGGGKGGGPPGGGKGGGGKGGGGKGGGGKGKKGGGCSPGDIVIVSGLPKKVFQAVKDAFDNGVTDPGGTDVTVRLECRVAQQLLFAVATNMGTNFLRKKRKGKKGGK